MLHKLALSALSLIGFGQQSEKQESVAITLDRYIPVHDIRAIITGYLNCYEPIRKIAVQQDEHQFSDDSRFFVSINNRGSSSSISVLPIHKNQLSQAPKEIIISPQASHCKFVAACGKDIVLQISIKGSKKQEMLLFFDVEQQRIEKTLAMHSGTYSNEFAANGSLLAVFQPYGPMTFYDIPTHIQIGSFKPSVEIYSLQISSDKNYIIGHGHSIHIFRIADGHMHSIYLSEMNIEGGRSIQIAAFAGEFLVIKLNENSTIFIWDFKTKKEVLQFNPDFCIYNVLSPDGLHLVCQTENLDINLWHTLSGKKLRTLEKTEKRGQCFWATNNLLLFTGKQNILYIYDLKADEYLNKSTDLRQCFACNSDTCSMSPDGRFLAKALPDERENGDRTIFQLYENAKIAFEQEPKKKVTQILGLEKRTNDVGDNQNNEK